MVQIGGIFIPLPFESSEGYQQMYDKLEEQLTEITGFAGTSLQPNSGAQGEFAGLMVIRAYHESRGDHHEKFADSLIGSRNQSGKCRYGRHESGGYKSN